MSALPNQDVIERVVSDFYDVKIPELRNGKNCNTVRRARYVLFTVYCNQKPITGIKNHQIAQVYSCVGSNVSHGLVRAKANYPTEVASILARVEKECARSEAVVEIAEENLKAGPPLVANWHMMDALKSEHLRGTMHIVARRKDGTHKIFVYLGKNEGWCDQGLGRLSIQPKTWDSYLPLPDGDGND